MKRDFITGILTGMVIGGACALMFAPVEGAKARNIIKEAAHSTRTRVRSAATKAGRKAHEKVGAIKQAI
ncbi:YtxH domain-containing protein [bacterium]|nr:YtxH domain-containing protein [bacterium]